MNYLKKSIFFFSVILTVSTVLISCQKDTTIDEVVQETEIQKRATPGGNNNATCYTATLLIDADCNGSYIGSNEETYSLTVCWQTLQDMIDEAEAKGWCYDTIDTEDNCLPYACYRPIEIDYEDF